MRKFFFLLRDYKKQMIIGPLFKMLEAVFELIIPVVMARLIDSGIKAGNTREIWLCSAGMLLLAAAGLASALICQYSASITSQGFGTLLRDRLFAHILRLPPRESDRFAASSLTARLTSDINTMQLAVAMAIRLLLRAPFLCVGGVVSAMLIDWRLSLVILAALPVFTTALIIITSISVKLYKIAQKKLDSLVHVVASNLEGIRVIRAFARSQSMKSEFDEAAENHRKASVRAASAASLGGPVTALIINTAILLIIWFGGIRVNSGSLTDGQLIALISYMTQILAALIVSANLFTLFTRASASAARVAEVMETVPPFDSGLETQPLPPLPAPLEFENVSLSYGGEEAVCGISFAARPGEAVGIIGSTGSGKTSLINMIPRLYDPTKGRITLGGTDIKSIPTDTLRRIIGLVPQRTNLFSGTVFSNIQMNNPNITEADAELAAEIAQASEFIEKLPQKYNSPVERGGANFSGGQKQRLAIARALAKKPSILILDDSTSALDLVTEASFRAALAEYSKEIIVITVTGRVSALMNADKIIVLDEGRAAGIGTHSQLLRDCAEYREICRSQGIGGLEI